MKGGESEKSSVHLEEGHQMASLSVTVVHKYHLHCLCTDGRRVDSGDCHSETKQYARQNLERSSSDQLLTLFICFAQRVQLEKYEAFKNTCCDSRVNRPSKMLFSA
ncbi:Hypothetical predicted protein [Podarcis lilfordi]|uniref:Uncharacterized protein n=1 Tax=Podarcis lilfordi TaxID=74358 RepID=A0AA35K1T1_9SAUR|nr:Hypothetical predicted protein [Podarcis lilfordi]